jgi:hypothetical protein
LTDIKWVQQKLFGEHHCSRIVAREMHGTYAAAEPGYQNALGAQWLNVAVTSPTLGSLSE